MLLLTILLATLSPIFAAPFECKFYCDGFATPGFGSGVQSSGYTQPNLDSLNHQITSSMSGQLQQQMHLMQQQHQQYYQQPQVAVRPQVARYVRPAHVETFEPVQTPVQTTYHQGSPMKAMFAHHNSASSSSMGYIEYPGQVTAVQTQPLMMQPVKQQPCQQYLDPCY